jgi:hypothetical protein
MTSIDDILFRTAGTSASDGEVTSTECVGGFGDSSVRVAFRPTTTRGRPSPGFFFSPDLNGHSGAGSVETENDMLLEAKNLRKDYGGTTVLDGASL